MKGNLNYQASYVARLWRYVALLFSLTLAAPLWAQQSIDFGAYHALVIGNNDYQHLDRLTTGVADARGVARLLREKYGFRVTSLIDADRGQILRALGDMRRDLDEKDNLLIYYAGHGTLDSNTGAGFWQPVDAHPQYDDKWISTDTITRKLNGINAKHVMVVADSCYAGALFERKSASELPTGRERQAWLARMARKGSRTALASGGLEPVMDRGGSGHSVFARVFLDVLEENSEVLDGDRLFDLVKHTVVRKASQTPRYDTIRWYIWGQTRYLSANMGPAQLQFSNVSIESPDGQKAKTLRSWWTLLCFSTGRRLISEACAVISWLNRRLGTDSNIEAHRHFSSAFKPPVQVRPHLASLWGDTHAVQKTGLTGPSPQLMGTTSVASGATSLRKLSNNSTSGSSPAPTKHVASTTSRDLRGDLLLQENRISSRMHGIATVPKCECLGCTS